MSRPRYFFLLPEPLPSDEIPKLMGRVVAHKFNPMDLFAPSGDTLTASSGSGHVSHNPEDIIPAILPEPTIQKNVKTEVHADGNNSFRLSLTGLVGTNLKHSDNQQVHLDSEEVKKYSLSNPERIFRTLIANDDYAADVEDLVRASNKRHVYLITGFMTTRKTKWSRINKRGRLIDGDITVPITAAAGAPIPLGIAEPSLGGTYGSNTGSSVSSTVDEEQVFAIKYNVIKWRLTRNQQTRTFERKTAFGAPKRANPRELALAHDSDEEDVDADASRPDEIDLFLADESDDKEYDSET